jgi:hypothetical protein
LPAESGRARLHRSLARDTKGRRLYTGGRARDINGLPCGHLDRLHVAVKLEPRFVLRWDVGVGRVRSDV